MATKNSTGSRASRAKPAAAAAAPALSINPSAAPALLPNYYDLIHGLLNVKGSLRLAHFVVDANMGANPQLQDADGVLTLAERELARIYALMDGNAVRDLWKTTPSSEESDDE